MLTPTFKKELEEALRQEKTKLEEELSYFAKKDARLAGGFSTVFPQFGADRDASQDENANEVEEYEKLLGLEYALEKRLKEVNGALERMHTKEFGKCEKCGREIPKERLKANPAALTCLRD